MPSPNAIARRLYQAVWRWHFWAGILISPVLIILSVTGAIYVFKAELEHLMYPDLMFVDGEETTSQFEDFREAIQENAPKKELRFINISANPKRAWEGFAEIHLDDGTETISRYYFDHTTGNLNGILDNQNSFFRVVLAIHRRLVAGTFGRLITETATCWGIISVLTGLWLWWPKGKEKVMGVWVPRLSKGGRNFLRDLHTVPAVYFCLFILAIMITGLLFTRISGTAIRAGTLMTGGFPDFFVSPPKSVIPEGKEDLKIITIDEAVEIAFNHFDFSKDGYGIGVADHDPDDAYQIITSTQAPLAHRGAIYIDKFSGETLVFNTNKDLPWQTHALLAFYPIHTGSIFGLGTKIIAVISCILIILMSVTAIMMWWKRRPKGQLGVPNKVPPKTVPTWMVWLTVLLAIFLPTVGLTLIFAFLFSLVYNKINRDKRRPAER